MGRLISLIYFYLISVIGLILLIIGLYNSISYVVNITQYDIYPLRYAGSENCDYLTQTVPVKTLPSEKETSPSSQEAERQKKDCVKRVGTERKQTKVNDLKNSLYFTFVGALLLGIHLPIALRKSSEKNK